MVKFLVDCTRQSMLPATGARGAFPSPAEASRSATALSGAHRARQRLQTALQLHMRLTKRGIMFLAAVQVPVPAIMPRAADVRHQPALCRAPCVAAASAVAPAITMTRTDILRSISRGVRPPLAPPSCLPTCSDASASVPSAPQSHGCSSHLIVWRTVLDCGAASPTSASTTAKRPPWSSCDPLAHLLRPSVPSCAFSVRRVPCMPAEPAGVLRNGTVSFAAAFPRGRRDQGQVRAPVGMHHSTARDAVFPGGSRARPDEVGRPERACTRASRARVRDAARLAARGTRFDSNTFSPSVAPPLASIAPVWKEPAPGLAWLPRALPAPAPSSVARCQYCFAWVSRVCSFDLYSWTCALCSGVNDYRDLQDRYGPPSSRARLPELRCDCG